MFQKIKNKLKNFITNQAAFSLVELIVVIAIMAVMAAVLAPSLLGYVERSRAQKDSSAMDELSNSITLAIADQEIYDELLVIVDNENFSCYADGDSSTNTDANKVVTKSPSLWLYNDNCRLLDETPYKPAGKMRGVTITFRPNGKSEYILKDGIVNQIGATSTKKGPNALAGKQLVETDFEGLYNNIRSTIGDTIKVSSQTYRNSDYTIFISMGTTGGNQADKQDAIQVYGQYNGTNLSEVVDVDNISAPNNSQDSPSGENPPAPSILKVKIQDVEYEYTDGMTWREFVNAGNAPLVIAQDENGDELVYYENAGGRSLSNFFFITNQEIDFNKTYSNNELIGFYNCAVKADDIIFPFSYRESYDFVWNIPCYDDKVITQLDAYEDYYVVYNNGSYKICEVP